MTECFDEIKSLIPKNFSRYFILELLKNKPHSKKEIIEYTEQSNEMRKPSNEYLILERLVDEGLIKETEDEKYQLTSKGEEVAEDIKKINDIVREHLDSLFRLGNVGKFITMGLIEKISMLGAILCSNMDNIVKAEKCKQLLESELKKIQEKDVKSNGKHIKID